MSGDRCIANYSIFVLLVCQLKLCNFQIRRVWIAYRLSEALQPRALAEETVPESDCRDTSPPFSHSSTSPIGIQAFFYCITFVLSSIMVALFGDYFIRLLLIINFANFMWIGLVKLFISSRSSDLWFVLAIPDMISWWVFVAEMAISSLVYWPMKFFFLW